MNITLKIPGKALVLPAMSELIKGALLIAVARSGTGGMSPAGLAFAATFSPRSAYIALIGLTAGVADTGIYALKYILSFFIYYMLSFLKKPKNVYAKSITLGAAVVSSGVLSFLWTGTGIREAVLLPAEAIASGTLYYLFTFQSGKTAKAHFARLIITGTALGGIGGIILPYINVSASICMAAFLVMSLAYACEMPLAAVGSALLGFVMYIGSGEAVMIMGAFCIAAVLSSLLSGMGKLGIAVGFLCGAVISLLYRGTLSGITPLDVLVPAVVFAAVPESVHLKISGFICNQFAAEYEEENGQDGIAERLKTVARAVSDLSEGITVSDERKQKISPRIFDTVADRVCSGCPMQESCWRKDGSKTYRNMQELLSVMERDGYCDHTNLPIGFRQVCLKSESFLCEFRHAYELEKQNAILRGEAGAGRDIMAKQYSEISGVIELLSEEVRVGRSTKEQASARFSPRVTLYQEAKPGQSVCGDTILHFETAGRYYVILCDGMGSGDGAKSESRLTARLFEEFLKAGFSKETGLRMINSALALKADQESFSTVDLLEIDLETGECEFLKIGSAQSFLKTKNGVESISSKALPVGILEDIEAEPQIRQLSFGDAVLILSDGVGEAGCGVMKNEWIKKLLLMENRSDGELCRLIVSGAESRSRFSDDMTCCIVRIEKRKGGEKNEHIQ